MTSSQPGSPQRALADGPEVEPPVRDDVVAERSPELGRDVLADLVTARADPGTDRGR